jgi:hypothetical protein
MRKHAIKIALTGAILILALFIIFLINQTVQLVAFGDRIHPLLGSIILLSLLILYALCIIVPLYLFFTMPAPLIPPQSETSPEFPKYLNRIARRLSKNPFIGKPVASSKDDVECALQTLDQRADEVIKTTASRIFITTAISQSGKLDALIVLSAQSRLVLEVARIYYQRPTIRNLLYLYANVASMVFFASELEDIDYSEFIQPTLTGIFGSAAGAIPGFQVASILLISSVISGSSNAFLTLRVGAIAKQYCRSMVMPSKQAVRRYATLEATKMLGTIVAEGTKKISAIIWTSSKSKMGTAVGGMGTRIKKTAVNIANKVRVKPADQNQ